LILPSTEGHHQHFPIWSRDGQWFYLVRGRPITGEMDLWRVHPDGSKLERLTEGLRNVTYPVPLDDRTVLFCAHEPDGAGPWLWALDTETKEYKRASVGVEYYSSVSASADGRRIVATVANPQATVWRIPIQDRVATESDAAPLPLPTVRALAPRVSGDQLFYLSSRGAGDGLWKYEDGKSTEIWDGAKDPLLDPPAVSPDGQALVLTLQRGGRQQLHVLRADGAELRALTDLVDVRGTASWSPDGRWIVVSGWKDGVQGLYRVPVDGGAPEAIVLGEALDPVWSPAGDCIVYTDHQIRAYSSLKCVTPDGAPIEIPPIFIIVEEGGERTRFLPDGKRLIYMQGKSFAQDFYMLDLGTMKSRRLTRLDNAAAMRTFDVTPDGSAIIFDRVRRNSDLVLIERPDI
jgi:Tol biopolymer transport system component